jgi:Restriction Enzyme Adenine Methylase Associated
VADPDSPARSSEALRALLAEIAVRIAQYRGAGIGEQNTKGTLINPVLRVLGWDVEDLEQVRHEYKRVPSDKPVDYALMLARTARLFVEAKALDENLDDRRWRDQIIGYAMVAGVEWVALTNGDEYRLYNAHAPVPIEEKLFRRVRITDDLDSAAEALRLLTKERIEENALSVLWQAYSVDRKVKDAVVGLFLPEPSPWLVRRLARSLDGLTQGDIRAALARARIVIDLPDEEQPGRPRRPPVTRRPVPVPDADDETKKRKPRRPRRPEEVSAVTLRQLIDAGRLAPPVELTRHYKGTTLSGRIEKDGRVSFDGIPYDSPSTAAGMARRSVVGARPGRKYPQTNGWTFWKFLDADGQLRELNVLRERLAGERHA